ncbi:MAG: 3-oxoacyl-ACP synthase III [Pirellulales bacterium]|nr:3-oxoacyl-ACP synthase III [Pirellulales bacterium]
MRYHRVCLEAFGYTLPENVVTSDEIEARLEPLYRRLKLPVGRLELMTGIRERRFWAPGTLPSEKSVASAERAIEAADIDRRDIGALVHASVCRDYLEPATATVVHHRLGLSPNCFIYDLSNACLGFLNGIVHLANMIELGQIKAGLVVASEGSRELVENTIATLNADESLTRQSVKLAVASLTIGSGSVAAVVVDEELTRANNRLLGGIFATDTSLSTLCHSGRDEAVAGEMRPLMSTDSERMMTAGVELARGAFDQFLHAADWTRGAIDKTICHQVGLAHRKLLFDALRLDPAIDFTTVEQLGNTGSVALPITLAMAAERGWLVTDDQVALLGIGSGINVLMLAAQWQKSLVLGNADLIEPAAAESAL